MTVLASASTKPLGRVEELGSGVLNVYRFIKEYSGKQTPEFIEGAVFKMIIPIPEMKMDGGLNGGLNDGLNPELIELYQAVKENPGKKAKELAEILSRPIDTVDKQIGKLIDKKLIERRGSRKTGGYYILSS